MKELQTTNEIGEGSATEIIMDACRANPTRLMYCKAGYEVSFIKLPKGDLAYMRDASNGKLVATAIVDEFDN